MNTLKILPFTSAKVSLVFAFFIFRRYLVRKASHLLLWSIGMVFYGIGGLSEAFYSVFCWNPLVFRLWYLFSAILVAAWLGQGTVYLLARKRIDHVLMAILVLGSLYSLVRVLRAEMEPAKMTASLHTGGEIIGHAITTSGVRSLSPFFNLYGTITLVRGALYSSWIF